MLLIVLMGCGERSMAHPPAHQNLIGSLDVRGNLCFQCFDSWKALFCTYIFNKFYRQIRIIEVQGYIQQVDLDQAFLSIKRWTDPNIGYTIIDGRICLGVTGGTILDMSAHHVDAVGRQQFLWVRAQVRGRKAEQPAALVAMLDASFDDHGMAKQLVGFADTSFADQVADARAADAAWSGLLQRNGAELDTTCLAILFKKGHIAGPVASEAKVSANDQPFDGKLLVQLIQKRLGRHRGHFAGEMDDDTIRDLAVVPGQGDLLLKGRQKLCLDLRPYDVKRMRFEGHEYRLASELLRQCGELMHQSLMSKVDAVEVADRDCDGFVCCQGCLIFRHSW